MFNNLNKRQRITLFVVLALLIVIPLVLYLVQQPQILRGRAQVDQRLLFLDRNTTNTLPGDPATTTTREVTLRIDHSGNNVITPPAGPNPPSSGTPTLNATIAGTFPNNATVTVTWSGVNATDDYWYIKDSTLNQYVYLGTCNWTPQLVNSQVRPSGSCPIYPPSRGTRTYQLYHSPTPDVTPDSNDILIVTSNPVTVN